MKNAECKMQNGRLIDANALMKAIREDHDRVMQDPRTSHPMKWREDVCYQRVKYFIEKATTVDAVEVVRCVKCKHFKRGPQKNKCLNPFGGMLWPQPEDWCSYGERRADDGT